MYSLYMHDRDEHTTNHIYILYEDFNMACDAMEDLLSRYFEFFVPPDRTVIKEMLERRHVALYYSDMDQDFIIRDLPVLKTNSCLPNQ